MKIEECCKDDGQSLADIRALAMRESLESVGRFDPEREKDRFLSGFVPGSTRKILIEEELVGFFVTLDRSDHIYLDHLYIRPEYQGKGIGSAVLNSLILGAKEKGKSIRLGALKQSRSNDFYIAHGFSKTHEEEFDNYYELEWKPGDTDNLIALGNLC